MGQITIATDGTIENTKLNVGEEEVTKDKKVISINLYASAPYKSKYSGDNVQGYVSCSYEYSTDNKTIERKSLCSAETAYNTGIGTKMESSDSVIRYIGSIVDEATGKLIDKITATLTEKKLPCPSRDVLLSRTIESLKDKLTDLGVKLEDEVKHDEPKV